MARYTCLFTVAIPLQHLHQQVIETLKSCNLEIIYNSADYIMGREVPGQIPFAKLVTAEVLIDKTTATDAKSRMSMVIKNEELPLQMNNHCHQMFERIHQAMAENRRWELIDRVVS
jgi:uncharacterized protein (DUF39 family)